MKPFASSDLVAIWERGQYLHPLDRGLLLLATAYPERSVTDLADRPVGQCNAMLAALRCMCFGSTLRAWTRCEKCSQKMEFEVDGRMFAAGLEDGNPHAEADVPISIHGSTFRVPTTRDVAKAARDASTEDPARSLAHACLIGGGGAPLSDECLTELGHRLALADPMAEITVALRCPDCGFGGQVHLDMAEFLWAEIAAAAKRVLLDVHELASAYGWSEQTILGLSEQRRAFYVERVQA